MNAVGAAQSAVYTAFVQHKRSAWTIGFDIDLWSTLYGVRLYYFAYYSSMIVIRNIFECNGAGSSYLGHGDLCAAVVHGSKGTGLRHSL